MQRSHQALAALLDQLGRPAQSGFRARRAYAVARWRSARRDISLNLVGPSRATAALEGVRRTRSLRSASPAARTSGARSRGRRPALELTPHVVDLRRRVLAVEHPGADLDRVGHRPAGFLSPLRALAHHASGALVGTVNRSITSRSSSARTTPSTWVGDRSMGSCGFSDASMGTHQSSRGAGQEADGRSAERAARLHRRVFGPIRPKLAIRWLKSRCLSLRGRNDTMPALISHNRPEEHSPWP